MARLTKKNQFDGTEDSQHIHSLRKARSGHKSALAVTGRHDRHHGWGYAKRRAVLNDE